MGVAVITTLIGCISLEKKGENGSSKCLIERSIWIAPNISADKLKIICSIRLVQLLHTEKERQREIKRENTKEAFWTRLYMIKLFYLNGSLFHIRSAGN
jgi:hypothetical protein